MGFCWIKKFAFVDRNLFVAIPFFSAGVGGDELLRGIDTGDAIHILAAFALIIQGLFAAFIFIQNGIAGQGWKCRNAVFFVVGAITGLMTGLTIYYPMALDLDRRATNQTLANITDTQVTESLKNETSTERILTEKSEETVSKLWFLFPGLMLSILVLVNTVYGLSVKLQTEEISDEAPPHQAPGSQKEELEAMFGDTNTITE